LQVLASFKSYSPTTQQEDMNHHTSSMARARTETTHGPSYSMTKSDRGYPMPKRFHLPMLLYACPLQVKVTSHMDRSLQWPHVGKSATSV